MGIEFEFYHKIHKSISTPLLVGGVPREIAFLNGTLTAAIVLGGQNLLGLPLGLLIHFIAVKTTKVDEQFFDVFRRHLQFKERYEG